MAKLVSKTYADAMFSLALEENRLDEFLDASVQMLNILQENTDFLTLIRQPELSDAEKEKIIEEIFERKLPKEMIGLLVLLVQKHHADEMESVFSYFIRLAKQEKKIGKADVTTAVTLSEEKEKAILNRLLEVTSYERMEIRYTVDRELIGGMVIRIGDRRIDTSIRTKLEKISRDLRKIQV